MADLNEKAKEILKQAEDKEIKDSFFFTTTFQAYLTQTNIMNRLQREIDNGDAMVSRSYVSGKENLYINPAISEYNKVANERNGTLAVLMNIIKQEEPQESAKVTPLKLVLDKHKAV